MKPRHIHTLIAGLAVTGALAGAAPAAASSIAYVKGGNIYLTSPDGQHGYELTSGGGWSSPSQADDGTVVAVRGQDIVRLDRSGHVLSAFAVVGGSASSAMSGATSLAGPYDAEVSPDGSAVAYWDMGDLVTPSPECGANCGTEQYGDVVSVTAADHFTFNGYDDDSAEHPHWIGGSGQLLFTDTQVNPQARLWAPGPDGAQQLDGNESPWFGDPPQALGDQTFTFLNTVPSRDQSKVAVVASANGATGPYDHLLFYSSSPPAGSSAPAPQCAEAENSGLNDLSWAPDGSAIAFDDPAGIEILNVPAGLNGCAGFTPHALLIPGGTQPFWGPADVNMAQAPGAGSTTPGSTPETPAPPAVPGGHRRPRGRHHIRRHRRAHHRRPRHPRHHH